MNLEKKGMVWGIVSGLVYYLLPEAFNLSSSTKTLLFIPEFIKILLTLPMQIVIYVSNMVGIDGGWGSFLVFIIAPILILLSALIGYGIAKLYLKMKK